MTGPQYLKSWLDAVEGDERFVLCLGAGVINTVLVACGVIPPDIFAMLIGGTVGAFIAGNTYENTKNANVAQA